MGGRDARLASLAMTLLGRVFISICGEPTTEVQMIQKDVYKRLSSVF